MPTQCTETRRVVKRVEGRVVVAKFDGGELTSDAGALLLGRTDETLGLLTRLAECFRMRVIRSVWSTRCRRC